MNLKFGSVPARTIIYAKFNQIAIIARNLHVLTIGTTQQNAQFFENLPKQGIHKMFFCNLNYNRMNPIIQLSKSIMKRILGFHHTNNKLILILARYYLIIN